MNKGIGHEIMDRAVDQLPQNVTSRALANLLGLTAKRISNMVADGKLSTEGHNKYNLKECTKKYLNIIKAKKTAKNSEVEKAKLEKLKRENSVAAKELLDRSAAGQLFMNLASVITDQLESLAPRISSELAAIDDASVIQEKLFEESRRIRETISREVEISGISRKVP